MRIAVCDDEQDQLDITTGQVKAWSRLRNEPVELFTYHSAAEFLFYWPDEIGFDLVFLDIRMKNMSGIELAQLIRKNDSDLLIVFITGLKDYVFQGYAVQALHYLLKPVRQADCFACLDRAQKIIGRRRDESFVIPLESQSIRLLYNEIYSFEIFSHYVEVHSVKGVFSFKKRMKELEQELPSGRFFRCHRSFIVNMHYVNNLKKNEVCLDNGTCIPVSKSRFTQMNNAFLKYYLKGMNV